MMNIILQGGPFHGRTEVDIEPVTRTFLVDEEYVYVIADGVFIQDLQVFHFDEKATERKRRKFAFA